MRWVQLMKLLNLSKIKTTDEARDGLMSRFGLDVDQSNAILEMQLRRLTGLEQDKVKAEYDELIKKIAEYESILASRQKIWISLKLNFWKIKKIWRR